MIIDNLQRVDIETIGDIKQVKASIDIENLDFITILLSSNLYSQPYRSFLREIVSNAWDSHVAANTTNEPVIIKITNKDVVIRDYGTGLSKEDFEDLYCKIGSSTKRDSNKYIGCFGLGHLTPLAVSNVVYISSYYNGVVRNYIMVQENGNIVTNYIGENTTDEHNGLSIRVECNIPKIIEELKYLVFFPNIYVDTSEATNYFYSNINDAKVVRYKNFSVCNLLQKNDSEQLYVLLGNVLYPLEISKLNPLGYNLKKSLQRCNICLNVEIGDINVTPNRESIIYSSETIELLNKKLEDAVEELNSLACKLCKTDYDSIINYAEDIKTIHYYNPINNIITGFSTNSMLLEGIERTLLGELKSEDFNTVLFGSCNNSTIVAGYRAYINDDGIIKNSNNHRNFYTRSTNYIKGQFIAIENNKPLGIWVKLYLTTKGYKNYTIVNLLNEEEFKRDFIRHSSSNYAYNTDKNPDIIKYMDEIVPLIYKEFRSKITIITEKEIEDFKDNNKSDTSYKRDNSKYTLHEVTSYGMDKTILSGTTIDNIIKALKPKGVTYSHNKFYIYNGRDTSNINEGLYDLLTMLNYRILWVSNTLYTKLLRYKSQCVGNEFSHVYFDISHELSNPCTKTEIILALNKATNNIGVKDIYMDNIHRMFPYYIHEIIDKHIKGLNDIIYKVHRICRLEEFKDYTLKSPEAIALNDAIEYVNSFNSCYLDLVSKMVDVFKYTHQLNSMTKYKLFKKFIHDKTPINISNYLKLCNSSFIKKIYE